MTPVPLLAVVLLAAWPDASADRASYEKARSEAGRDADAQVRLALWCEAHGLPAERLKHLALATLRDPSHATARGLMGLVAYRGKWQSPDAVADKIKADRKLADALAAYDGRRERMPDTADAHWQLAVWCEQNGLSAEATAHMTVVVRLDPSREQAWRRLGYARHGNRWMTAEQVAAEKAEADARKLADRTWTPLLEKWKGWLARDDKRAEAEAGLLAVADPYAIPSIVKVFGASDHPGSQARAVQLLGQIDTPASTRALAVLSVRGGSPEARRAAKETLAHRDPREFIGLLLNHIRRPRKLIRYALITESFVEGYPKYALRIEDEDQAIIIHNEWYGGVLKRLFSDDVVFDPAGGQAYAEFGPWGWPGNQAQQADAAQLLASLSKAGGPITAGGLASALKAAGHGRPAIDPATALVREATWAASIRDAQIARRGPLQANGSNFNQQVFAIKANIDASNSTLDADNAAIASENSAVYDTLKQTTGRSLPDDEEAWKTWWIDQLGYSYRSPGRQQEQQVDGTKPTTVYTIISCFAAGTPVRTVTGDRPIETLRVGDRVLSQDTATGALAYRPITRVHHNPPSEVLRVRMGGETILATGFHRFWKAGQGWAMARELKAGDVLRTLGGLASVESVEADQVQPVFNLDVADDADFFVGKAGALVHDNTLPDPRALPFDAPRPVAVARRGE